MSVITALPCFASGALICLNPGLIHNFVQGTKKTSETTWVSTQVPVQNQV